MKKIAIIGAGGFAREVKQQMLDNDPNLNIEFFVEDQYVNENCKPISSLEPDLYLVLIAIGDPVVRKKMVSILPKNTNYGTFIHHTAQILDENIEIGPGSIICPNVILTTNIKLGSHTHLNLSTTIGHDTIVGDFFTTAPGAKISGNCTIGNNVYIGTNASVREKIKICDNVIIGLNSGVVKSIDESGTYGGIPTRKIK
jgi:sugar O-acyltransferase (sialic acid O-acetyltransferase NeuD family)